MNQDFNDAGDDTRPDLGRHQPCGCLVCHCDDGERCQGCGSRACGTDACAIGTDAEVYADGRTGGMLRNERAFLAAHTALRGHVAGAGMRLQLKPR